MLDAAIAIGEATGLERQAEAAVTGWRDRFHRALDLVTPYAAGPRVAALEWTDPVFIAGMWMAQMIERAGGEHPLSPTRALAGAGSGAGAHGAHRVGEPAKQIEGRELVDAGIETLIVAPCGEPMEAALRAIDGLSREPWWEDLPAARSGRVIAADGRLLSRPGPRLVDGQEWLVSVLAERPGADPGTVEHRIWSG
jgi:iron complex transport system substrate-binding protein